MPSGSVKKWLGDKGFGFVTPSDGGDDVFVHFRVLANGAEALEEGDEVTYEVEYDDRKGKWKASTCTVKGGGSGGGGGGGGYGGGKKGGYDGGYGGGKGKGKDKGHDRSAPY
mmetsp:Transcript_45993/g.130069  ORF Transcript_45993/g.130069 Transcript_45993/m.130069 type:complete len:112 (-) Transcript_45993:183-518(-)